MKKDFRFVASHPEGLYLDSKTNKVIYEEEYKVTKTGLNHCFGSIEIERLRDGGKSIIEPEWFNQRTIKPL